MRDSINNLASGALRLMVRTISSFLLEHFLSFAFESSLQEYLLTLFFFVKSPFSSSFLHFLGMCQPTTARRRIDKTIKDRKSKTTSHLCQTSTLAAENQHTMPPLIYQQIFVFYQQIVVLFTFINKFGEVEGSFVYKLIETHHPESNS